jgi:AmmeMemoRadiSam system protein B
MTRNPVVSGRFYPGSAQKLNEFIHQVSEPHPAPALGVMVPHAGYIYSGATAAKGFDAVEITPTVLLLGPNHTGYGAAASIVSSGSWRTPLGETQIDTALAGALKKACPLLKEDPSAHEQEHSLEVQLPFLQARRPDVKIVPIAFMLRSSEQIAQVGREIGEALQAWPEKVLMVASSDMSHYEPADIAREKDAHALKKVLGLDGAGLLATVAHHHISMCGVIPTAVMLGAANVLGAHAAVQLDYTNSGDETGDYSSVVGYATVAVN